MNKKFERNMLLILLVCGLLVVGSYSYAYFTSGVAFTGPGSKGEFNLANLVDVKYDAGTSTLNLDGAYPGVSASKDFNVNFIPTNDIKTITYAIKLVIDNNTFVKCDDTNHNETTNACIIGADELVYTLKDSNDTVLSTGDITAKTGTIEILKETKTTEAEVMYNYKLELAFKDTGNDQNHNTNKTMTGSLKVEFAE